MCFFEEGHDPVNPCHIVFCFKCCMVYIPAMYTPNWMDSLPLHVFFLRVTRWYQQTLQFPRLKQKMTNLPPRVGWEDRRMVGCCTRDSRGRDLWLGFGRGTGQEPLTNVRGWKDKHVDNPGNIIEFHEFHDAKVIQAVVCLFPGFESVDESRTCSVDLVFFQRTVDGRNPANHLTCMKLFK